MLFLLNKNLLSPVAVMLSFKSYQLPSHTRQGGGTPLHCIAMPLSGILHTFSLLWFLLEPQISSNETLSTIAS